MAKTLLETGQESLFIAGLHMDEPIGVKSGLRYRRHEQIPAGDDPEDLTARAGSNTGRKQRCGRAVHRAIPTARHLMKCAQREPSSRQTPVDLGHAERKMLARTALPAFKPLDARAKLGDNGIGGGIGHSKNGSFQGFPAVH